MSRTDLTDPRIGALKPRKVAYDVCEARSRAVEVLAAIRLGQPRSRSRGPGPAQRREELRPVAAVRRPFETHQLGAILERRLAERDRYPERSRAWVFPSAKSRSGRIDSSMQHLNGRIGEARGAQFWFDALYRNFIAVAKDELEPPAGLAARLAGCAGPQYATEVGAAKWSMEELRDSAQRIAGRIDELAES